MTVDPLFGAEVEAAAREHALRDWPNESVGAVIDAAYVPLQNVDPDPINHFAVQRTVAMQPGLQGLIHSHSHGKTSPSVLDMTQQDAMGVPWGIVGCNEGATTPIFWWGPGVPPPPLIGRKYRFGPSGTDGRGDCYAIVKDWYLLTRGIVLRDVPRDEETFRAQTPWYDALFLDYGWREIAPEEMEEGDVVLMRIRMRVTNHAMLYLGNGLGMHHAENMLSAKVPVGPWLRFRTRCVRYIGHE